ncbi:hypothetical protein Q2T40_10735 [Winogradskyella maritima]|uniref:Uncharacterized protein n=1 Tax=Winogradskyella maritima TaxID=1517766 RepID=A0ABV8AMA8_9FLAO|nr:hypothetical protein [Winogradskyella maritima]
MKFTSLFHPFGKTIDLSNYSSYINVQQFSAHEDFISTYLIQENGIANFKMSSSEYVNHKQLVESLALSEVKRNLTFKDYMILLYVGKLRLKHKNFDNSNKSAVESYKKVLRFIILLGLVCVMLGMVLKMCSSI